jgi:hypothetical protein
MKRLLIIVILFPLFAQAQTNLLHVRTDPREKYERGVWGQNFTHYGKIILLADFYFKNNNEAVDYKGTTGVGLGYSYRYKLANPVNVGAALTFRAHWTNLNANGISKIYDSEIYKKGQLYTTEFRLNPFFRFNLMPRRGNYMGSYIDIGPFGAINLHRSLKVVNKTGDVITAVKTSPSDEINKYYYGLSASFSTDYSGIRFGISANWNLRPIADKTIETPRSSLGLMLIF